MSYKTGPQNSQTDRQTDRQTDALWVNELARVKSGGLNWIHRMSYKTGPQNSQTETDRQTDRRTVSEWVTESEIRKFKLNTSNVTQDRSWELIDRQTDRQTDALWVNELPRVKSGGLNWIHRMSYKTGPENSQTDRQTDRQTETDRQTHCEWMSHREWSWWRSIVVRTPVTAGELSLSCARLMDGRETTLWVRRPLSVNQHGQLSLPSLRSRLNE